MNILGEHMHYSQEVAQSLLSIKAVGFVVENPITFKSGIVSPVYIDNRRLPFHPDNWRVIIQGFEQLIEEKNLAFDVIAGIETAGIPHSATLGYSLEMPSVFVRKSAKDHGTKKMIEGGEVKGKTVLLLEDHITTGGSSLAGVNALRDAGASVHDCIAITSYGFEEAEKSFLATGVTLHTLTSFNRILPLAVECHLISEHEKESVEDWLRDPVDWIKKQGK
jgi:orotate phosphoribosyltransferase